jgi:hypothetical protein
MGMLCMQQVELDRDRCLAYFDQLIEAESLEGIGLQHGAKVEVAGVELTSKGACYFSRPHALSCPNGGIKFVADSPAGVRTALKERVATLQDGEGIEGFHNPHRSVDCRVGDYSTTCHEISYQGVLSKPISMYYDAVVDAAESSYHWTCSYSTRDGAPAPCKAVFGKFVRH